MISITQHFFYHEAKTVIMNGKKKVETWFGTYVIIYWVKEFSSYDGNIMQL